MKRSFALLSILAGLVLVFLAGFSLLKPSDSNGKKTGLPASIAGLPLTSSIEGEKALSELAQMHGTEFVLADGWIGTYGSSREATLWVAVSPDIDSSTRLLESMHDRIALGNSPFSPVGERKDGNRSIYELNGMGQRHFFFQSGKLLVWLAANEKTAQEAIHDALTFYP